VLSMMMDVPLTVTGLMRYGTTVYGDSEVVTCTTDGVRRQSYAQTGARAAQLAGALRELGVDGDQRVATLMWNNAEHLEAYLAVPSMGAVLHTLNLRLDHKQLSYIANHAGDHVIITEPTLVPLLAAILPSLETVRHIVLTGPPSGEGSADAGALVGRGHEVHYYEELLAAEPATFSWPDLDERAAAAMCYTSGTTGLPKGVVYSHRSTYLHAMGACLGNAFALSDTDRVLPVVPMFHANAWGLAYAALLSGADLVMPDRFLHPEPLVRLIEAERPTIAGRFRPSGAGCSSTSGPTGVTCPRCAWSPAAVPRSRTR
jgi:fatty-acyl-CoA synthase